MELRLASPLSVVLANATNVTPDSTSCSVGLRGAMVLVHDVERDYILRRLRKEIHGIGLRLGCNDFELNSLGC